MNGILYIVATPIGNLEDITLRALRILREADLIACEDTRQTRKLLDHFNIVKPAVSYHEHNEQVRSDELVRELESGKTVALVSDAGTPLIADPGYRLVQKARERGIAVTPVPGPSALVTALSACGLPTDSVAFLGFLPAKSGQRRKALVAANTLDMTLVFYETPHRILEALSDLEQVMADPPVVVARELTKLHEEWLSGKASEVRSKLLAREAVKGEFVILVGRREALVDESISIDQEIDELIEAGMGRMDAVKQVARRRGLSKREVYKWTHE
jgi:16S rRNA (cytidine1402-2'-O)-methyltransferase